MQTKFSNLYGTFQGYSGFLSEHPWIFLVSFFKGEKCERKKQDIQVLEKFETKSSLGYGLALDSKQHLCRRKLDNEISSKEKIWSLIINKMTSLMCLINIQKFSVLQMSLYPFHGKLFSHSNHGIHILSEKAARIWQLLSIPGSNSGT